MAIEITARHLKISDAVRGHAEEKLAKLEQEFPRLEHIRLIMSAEKYRCTAEIVVQGRRQHRLEAQESSDNMYLSIDRAVEKIEKQLRKRIDQRRDRKGKLAMSEAAEKLASEEAE